MATRLGKLGLSVSDVSRPTALRVLCGGCSIGLSPVTPRPHRANWPVTALFTVQTALLQRMRSHASRSLAERIAFSPA
ncbi:hypothetical protein SKAU_G00165620 [Synaphobranchus kaupii]|uniref:Uncharacterized protein n=1 Tax=Synaphobranchus kaupii TaxID=118154 RepID=A0A9Q1FJD1_SYNKA|nr:hypothetical protein SKAU_G00165620 [Synaphobranchus kaupii]